uniref:VWFA domain-containing protein n=1 Tax=Ciona savignyi TaxID=51511 RepID=H2YWR1_CIOSA
MDIMFLLDGSGSMNTYEFNEMLNFVTKVVDSFNFTTTRVGVMQFSHWFDERSIYDQPYMQSDIQLGMFASNIQFKVALSAMRHHGYTSFTAHAIHKAIFIDLASSDRFTDLCTKKVIIVVIDGRSLDHSMLLTNANADRALGVTMYAVGVSNYWRQELQVIANGEVGKNDRVFTAPQFRSTPSSSPTPHPTYFDVDVIS